MDGLEQPLLGDAGEREAGLVQGLGALGGGADAHRRERAADAREEAGLLGQGARVGHHREGVHLQAVVVVEAHGLVHAHARVELEAGGLQALAGARVAGVQDRHVVFLCERVNRGEQAREVRLGVDVLLAVRGQQHVALGLQAELGEDIRGLDLVQVGSQDLGHGRARDVGALGCAAGVLEVAAGVLGVGKVDVGDHVDDAAVGLLGQALVLAAVARLHVEDGDVQALGRDGGQAAVGVAQDQQRVGLHLHYELVARGDDVAHGLAQVGAHGVQVDVRVGKLQVAEEDAVERVVVVLPGVGQQAVEVAAALLDDLGQADDLGAGAHDDEQLEAAIVPEADIGFSYIHVATFLVDTFGTKKAGTLSVIWPANKYILLVPRGTIEILKAVYRSTPHWRSWMLIVAIDNHAAGDKYIGIRCQSTDKPNKTNLLAALSPKLKLASR